MLDKIQGEGDEWSAYEGGDSPEVILDDRASFVVAGSGEIAPDRRYRLSRDGDALVATSQVESGLKITKRYQQGNDPNVVDVAVRFENRSNQTIRDLWVGVSAILDGEAGPSNTHNQWGPLDTTTAGSLRLPNGVNTTGFSNTLNATFDITGVQLEEGTIPTPFEHRTYAEDLRDCQRYYFHTYRYGIDIGSTGSDNGAALSRQGSAVTNHHDFQVI